MKLPPTAATRGFKEQLSRLEPVRTELAPTKFIMRPFRLGVEDYVNQRAGTVFTVRCVASAAIKKSATLEGRQVWECVIQLHGLFAPAAHENRYAMVANAFSIKAKNHPPCRRNLRNLLHAPQYRTRASMRSFTRTSSSYRCPRGTNTSSARFAEARRLRQTFHALPRRPLKRSLDSAHQVAATRDDSVTI
jgi:hypothetical protein